jgi:DNA mismatch repair protein MSH6
VPLVSLDFLHHVSLTEDPAGNARAIDFLRVLKGFEQIQGAIEEIRLYGPGDGLIGKLLNMRRDLEKMLQPWATV